MSITYSIFCPETKKRLWIGQRNYIYSGEEEIANLSRFLYDHIGKILIFDRDDQGTFLQDKEQIIGKFIDSFEYQECGKLRNLKYEQAGHGGVS